MSRSKIGLLCLVLAIAAALVWTPRVEAQGVTTGSLSGLVTDESGQTALPGATIAAVHQPTGTRYSTVARGDGRFRIQNVRVGGPYSVEVNMDGFEPGETTNVFVSLGEDVFLTFGLQVAGVTETLTVVSESNYLISPSRTGAASNVSAQLIENLPTVGRGLEDFARTNPFFTVAAENEDPDAISVAGRSSRYNNIQIDGSVNNDLFGLADTGTPGGQADTTPISLDAIQEIQLVLADFDVRQGGFSGGSINAITRSGSNQFKGSVFYFTRDDSLVGDVDVLGQFAGLEEEQFGFRIGGPISRDKIFFFANAELTEKDTPTGWSIDGSSGQAFVGGDAVDDANRFRDFLISNYGFDPGPNSEQVRSTPSDKFFGRLDFNLGDRHQLTLRHNYVDAENDINRPSSGTFEFESETYLFRSETNSTVAQLNSTIGSNMFNEFRLTNQSVKDRRGGVVKFPWIEIERVEGEEFEAGTEPFSTRNAVDQDIVEITNDFTFLKGNHTITVGTHNELFTFENLFVQNAFGSYEFGTLDDFEAGIARRWRYTEIAPGQPDTQKFDVNQIGLYVGDQWAARGNLTLTYGLRVDIPFFPDTPSRNPLTEQLYGFRTDVIPDGEQLWQPRIGFNWDLKSDGQQQLRGGLGIFAGRTPYVWISNNYARTGIEQIFYEGRNVPFIADPDGQQPNTVLAGTSSGEFNLIDPDFQFPQVMRLNLAYDRQLPWWGLIASIEAVFADSQEEIDYRDLNLAQTGTSPADGRPVFTRVDRGVSGAYFITNTSEGEQTNIAVKLERPFRGKWSGFFSYTYGDSKTINDGTSSRAVSNFQFNETLNPNAAGVSTSDFEVEHRFNASLTYQFNGDTNYPTTISAFYNLQSGRPFSNIMGFQFFPSVNFDGYFSNDLMYVPSGPDDVVITNGTWEQLDAYISSQDCLNDNRGGIVPRNTCESPWSHSLDLRLAQDLPIRRARVQLTLDFINLLNWIDEDSGHLRYANFNTVDPVDPAGITDDGRYIYGLDRIVTDPANNSPFDLHNIRSRWRAKLGARVSF